MEKYALSAWLDHSSSVAHLALRDGVSRGSAVQANLDPESVEGRILDLLEERVRPFVQQDGGDVQFDRFDHDSGVLYLRMIGACSGCPKSSVTLNMGIRNLMEHYIPEVLKPRGHSEGCHAGRRGVADWPPPCSPGELSFRGAEEKLRQKTLLCA
eukprot:s5288_g5.t1